MNKRTPLIVLSAIWLSGCASPTKSEPTVELTDKPTSIAHEPLSIGWVQNDWRLCHENECPSPTTKTVEISVPAVVAIAKPLEQGKEKLAPQAADVRETVVVHFEFAKAQPAGDWRPALEAVKRLAAQSDRIIIKAYTDDLGTVQYNDRLARKRAAYVVSWLKANGVKNPMEVEAKGKCCYIASNDTEVGRAANRRAEINAVRR